MWRCQAKQTKQSRAHQDDSSMGESKMTHQSKGAIMREKRKKTFKTTVLGMSPSLEKMQTSKDDVRVGGMCRVFLPHFHISEMC